MMTYDRVLPVLLQTCETAPGAAEIERYCVVRDVKGRVRLAIKPVRGSRPSVTALETMLTTALGAYFAPPILSAASGSDVQRLASRLLEDYARKWPRGWPRHFTNLLGGAPSPVDVTRWSGVERTIGKEAWLAGSPPQPPWPRLGTNPPIITFHSFKGGVGRTTLVAAYAIHLASKGRRVAVIDLDLEAPGVGSLFGVATSRGVLDVLIDHLATGEIDLEGTNRAPALATTMDAFIQVFPAGQINDEYLAKLARLDFASGEPGGDNPVSRALEAMLKALKPSVDVVLLDSRAGLHDLAGLSLHGLAHVDVLTFRGTEQNLTGLEQTLRTLDARGAETELVLVETLLPPREDEFTSRHERTKDRIYSLLLDTTYPEDDPPQRDDVDEPHDVLPVRRKEWLDALDSMAGLIDRVLGDDDLRRVAKRLDARCGFLSTDERDESELES